MRTALGDGIHKVRVALSSKNKGKSGGARIITDITACLLYTSCSDVLLLAF